MCVTISKLEDKKRKSDFTIWGNLQMDLAPVQGADDFVQFLASACLQQVNFKQVRGRKPAQSFCDAKARGRVSCDCFEHIENFQERVLVGLLVVHPEWH